MDDITKYQVDDKHFLLFRGEIGLPMGMLPISPSARRLLWQGNTIQAAAEKCIGEVDIILKDKNRSRTQMKILQFSEANHYKNPFVSTTDNLSHALQYATRQYATEQGYISVLWIEKERCTQFRKIIDTPVTQAENEYGVNSMLTADEILFQIPIRVLDTKLYSSTKMSNSDLISHFLSTYAKKEYRFRQINENILSCPNCHNGLSGYYGEVLGFDSGAIQIFIRPKINNPSEDDTPEWMKKLLRNPDDVNCEMLALHGMLVCCPSCRKYICLPKRINSLPLKIIEQTYRKNMATLRMRNDAEEGIWYVVLRSSSLISGKKVVHYHERDLMLRSEDLMVGTIVKEPKLKTGIYQILMKAYSKLNKSMGGGVIQPGQEVIHVFDIGDEPASKPGFELSVFRVHFMSGKSWLSPDVDI